MDSKVNLQVCKYLDESTEMRKKTKLGCKHIFVSHRELI